MSLYELHIQLIKTIRYFMRRAKKKFFRSSDSFPSVCGGGYWNKLGYSSEREKENGRARSPSGDGIALRKESGEDEFLYPPGTLREQRSSRRCRTRSFQERKKRNTHARQ